MVAHTDTTRSTARILDTLKGNTSLSQLMDEIDRTEYQRLYDEADALYRNEYIAVDDQVIHHPAKWTRRIR